MRGPNDRFTDFEVTENHSLPVFFFFFPATIYFLIVVDNNKITTGEEEYVTIGRNKKKMIALIRVPVYSSIKIVSEKRRAVARRRRGIEVTIGKI